METRKQKKMVRALHETAKDFSKTQFRHFHYTIIVQGVHDTYHKSKLQEILMDFSYQYQQ